MSVCAWTRGGACDDMNVSWMQRVKRLLNTTVPELQIFNNYLED